jgi:hypothetical protein
MSTGDERLGPIEPNRVSHFFRKVKKQQVGNYDDDYSARRAYNAATNFGRINGGDC